MSLPRVTGSDAPPQRVSWRHTEQPVAGAAETAKGGERQVCLLRHQLNRNGEVRTKIFEY